MFFSASLHLAETTKSTRYLPPSHVRLLVQTVLSKLTSQWFMWDVDAGSPLKANSEGKMKICVLILYPLLFSLV